MQPSDVGSFFANPTDAASLWIGGTRSGGTAGKRPAVLFEQEGFVDSIIDEIPGKAFMGITFTMNVKVGVER